jgi:hypothetical protein
MFTNENCEMGVEAHPGRHLAAVNLYVPTFVPIENREVP